MRAAETWGLLGAFATQKPTKMTWAFATQTWANAQVGRGLGGLGGAEPRPVWGLGGAEPRPPKSVGVWGLGGAEPRPPKSLRSKSPSPR